MSQIAPPVGLRDESPRQRVQRHLLQIGLASLVAGGLIGLCLWLAGGVVAGQAPEKAPAGPPTSASRCRSMCRPARAPA